MSTEDLAMKHLAADLTKSDFWEAGIAIMKTDVSTFMELTQEYIK